MQEVQSTLSKLLWLIWRAVATVVQLTLLIIGDNGKKLCRATIDLYMILNIGGG